MPSRYTLAVKLRILDATRTGGDWEALAEVDNININTARCWLRRYSTYSDALQPPARGGKRAQKMTAVGLSFLLSMLSIDRDLTLRLLADDLEQAWSISVSQTVKTHLDASLITMKQFHKEPQYMNTEPNKLKRRDFLVRWQQLQAAGKSVIYMVEINFNLWSSRTRGRILRGRRAVKKVLAGGGQNPQVIACIGKGGVTHYETKLGSNKYQHSNEFISNTLRKFADVSNVVVVLDNAPCHAHAEAVFAEAEFAAATLPRLGPYSCMLNPIDNVFSAFKSAVKDFMTERRAKIIAVPPGKTMKAHRQRFLLEAAATPFPRVATAQLCASCYRHTLRFHVKVSALEDMPVGC
ncbi:unnamed protein product [Phytophthora fragariaefolia]|uniref:Unnamed protein product n=1 Tax=Phytophthora fragariaefolia TaxID=1490495 RepID=A0A9W6XLB8_9STRA|nr:unnamed protein product [Phytophthora fragariaefolia]